MNNENILSESYLPTKDGYVHITHLPVKVINGCVDNSGERKVKEMEDKQRILDLLLPALQATSNLSDLISLKYNQEEELVEARFLGGCKYANVALSSGTSMIRDVIHQIV